MAQITHVINYRVKQTSTNVLLFIFKYFSALVFGLTFGLVGQEMVGYTTLLFVFVTTLFAMVFLRLNRNRSWVGVFVFDLICILLGMLIRMYILIAPGA